MPGGLERGARDLVMSSDLEEPDLFASPISHFIIPSLNVLPLTIEMTNFKKTSVLQVILIILHCENQSPALQLQPNEAFSHIQCPGPPARHYSVGAPLSITQLEKQICQNNNSRSDECQS